MFSDDIISEEAGRDLLRDQLRNCLDAAVTCGIDISGGWQTDVVMSDRRYRISIQEVGHDVETGRATTASRADGQPVYRSSYDWSEWEPGVAVVDAVTDASNVEPTTLPRIYDTVDTDAIDLLLEEGESGATPAEVRFSYAGYRVTVDATGAVTLDEPPT